MTKTKMETMLLAMRNADAELHGHPAVTDIAQCDSAGIAHYRLLLDAAMKSVASFSKIAGDRITLIEPAGTGTEDNPWDLYTSHPGFKKANNALNAAWTKAEPAIRNAENSADVEAAMKIVTDVMVMHDKAGAEDTEPRAILAAKVRGVLREAGYVDAHVDRFGTVITGYRQHFLKDVPEESGETPAVPENATDNRWDGMRL